jgi:hypothetical protein
MCQHPTQAARRIGKGAPLAVAAERQRMRASSQHLEVASADRFALANPCWPQMAEIALGRKSVEAMDDWPVQYGWWLKHREWAIERIRADEAAAQRN